MDTIREFQGQYRFLSNFWPAVVRLDGNAYPSVENAYQAAKTFDMNARKPFMSAPPGTAKRLGRGLKLRPDWDSVKRQIMLDLLRQKFRHTGLRFHLLSTEGAALIEGNHWGDTFWGVDLRTGRGQNYLGLLLMQVRSELAKEELT